MKGTWWEHFPSLAIPWASALIVVVFLLWYHRKNKNPLEWSRVDRCLLLVGLFCFVGGASNFLMTIAFEHLPWVNWGFARSYYKINRIVGLPWILLLVFGLWLRRRSPENPVFTHMVIQLSAVSVSLVWYAFGPVTHPGPFLLGMTLGTLSFLLFDLKIALPWLITFTALTVGSSIATWAGLIPYAPIFMSSPFSGGKIETYYFVGTLVLAMVIFLLMLILVAHIFTRWRDRETRVVEMTDLLKKMFGRYLSTEVMNSFIEDPASLELGGERRRVTIMMTDLRGFTALSERLEPEQVVQMLNSYFEIMIEEVLKYNGTINEIIGDSLLVIFGAPQEMRDRTQRAIACAIEMQNAMSLVNQENVINGLPELHMGIGLNEADVIVGNIGSSKRSKYAVVGSGVNMASRIESYTVGGQILISDSVRREVGDILRIDQQQEVIPKGSEVPLKVYEVGGIGIPYNLTLQEKYPALVALKRQVPLLYAPLDGKDVGKDRQTGLITRLSMKGIEIEMEERFELLTNIKMNLEGVSEELASRDFYGKVSECAGETNFKHIVRFTSTPPEVAAYFQALQQYAAKDVSSE